MMNRETLGFSRTSDIFGKDSKPDSLDVRAVTAASKDHEGKRQKYRMNVTRTGAVIHGLKKHANSDQTNVKEDSDCFMQIEDPRATTMKIAFTDEQFHCMPSTERFSAHTGICQILGSKSIQGGKHKLNVGDIIRFGSVGLLIAEIETDEDGGSDSSLSQSEINQLTHRFVSTDDDSNHDFDSVVDTDDEGGDEGSEEDSRNSLAERESMGMDMCYVCYDKGEEGNELIAPCKCSGDTKYIHVNCLKRWNTGDSKNTVCSVIDETNAPHCSVCKTAYPSRAKLPSGKFVSLLPDRLGAPSISFVVITKHSSSSMSTNTRFQLSYSSLISKGISRPLLVGRSSQCDMVLKYRTVSTVHAQIYYQKGSFFVFDSGSSNGTLRYIYRPLPLECGKPVHIKFGRTIVSLKSRKKRLPKRLASLFSGFSIKSGPSSTADSESSQNVVDNLRENRASSVPTILPTRTNTTDPTPLVASPSNISSADQELPPAC